MLLRTPCPPPPESIVIIALTPRGVIYNAVLSKNAVSGHVLARSACKAIHTNHTHWGIS